MKNNKKVSVIIPTYNSALTIEKCLESLKNQSYKNIEIIVIDDGSIDNTVEIIKESYCNNVKLIIKENSGVSDTRNVGIDSATGEYLVFIDSDDWVEENYIRNLVEMIESNQSDMVISGYIRVNENSESKHCVKENRNVLFNEKNRQSEMYKIFFGSNGSAICSKIYKTKLIGDLRLQKIKVGEDMLFNINYISMCNSVYISNYAGYYYLNNQKSATNNLIPDVLKDLNDIVNKMERKDIMLCYVYRIYGEYVYNCYKYDVTKFYGKLCEIKNYEFINVFLADKSINKVVSNYMKNKKLYIKLVSFFIRNNFYKMLYIMEKLKLKIKRV